MALNLKSKVDDVVTPDLKKKVAAWWQGVDVEDLDWPEEEDSVEAFDEAEVGEKLGESVDPFSAQYDLSHFIVVSQEIWGKGFVTPGGPDFIDEWGQQLSLNKDKSSAFIGSGLGGQAREISKSTGSWITGYERIRELVEEGADQANMAGMAKNATSEVYDPETTEFPESKYDAILAKEEFIFIEDKARIIEQIAGSLKKKGLFMFTDYVSVDGDVPAPELEEMFGTLLGQPRLWTEKDYVSKMEDCGLDIHVNEDFSHRYVEFIGSGWSRYRDIVAGIKDGEESDQEKARLLHLVADAAEHWTRIATSLGSGDMQVRRFLARRV